MTTKLSPAQQDIVDAMRNGAYLGIRSSVKSYGLYTADGGFIRDIRWQTFYKLTGAKVIQQTGIDAQRRMKYELTDAYKEQS